MDVLQNMVMKRESREGDGIPGSGEGILGRLIFFEHQME